MYPVRILSIIILSACFCFLGRSQSARISGVVADSQSVKPISFVTVALVNDQKKKIAFTFSDSFGVFRFHTISPGQYRVSFSSAGYDSAISRSIQVGDAAILLLDTMFLRSRIKSLESVTVTARKPLVENKIDGLVYNATSEPQIAGGNAIDVLRKVPLLTITQDGAIGVLGAGPVRIYFDDKPVELFGISAADYLFQLPADRIERVRVITNPSAKYDAEGTGAVILVYTKKNRFKNLTGTIRLNGSSGPYRHGSSAGANLFFRSGKVAISLGGSYGTGWRFFGNILERNAADLSSQLYQNIERTSARITPAFNAAIDIEIDTLNSISITANFLEIKFQEYADQSNRFKTTSSTREYNRQVHEDGTNRFPIVSLAYSRRFKNPDKELSFLGYFNRRKSYYDYSLLQIEQQANNYTESFLSNSDNKETSLQLDYVHPVNSKSKWETGVKTSLRNADSRFETNPVDAVRSGNFSYKQSVYAVYLSYETRISKWQLRTGLRYEQTNLDAVFNNAKVDIDPYKNLVPNVLFSRAFKNKHSLSVGYSQFINRPNINSLNPAINYSDSFTITRGNPALDPMITNRVEVAYTVFMKANSFIRFSTFGTKSNNSIVQVPRLLPSGVLQNSVENIGHDQKIGFSIAWNQTYTPRFKSVIALNTSWVEQRIPVSSIMRNGCWLFASIYFNYSTKSGYVFDIFSFSQTPIIDISGKTYNEFPQYYFITVSKRFWKDRIGVSVTMDNFFTHQQSFINKIQDVNFKQVNELFNSNQVFQLRLTYRFNQSVTETRTRAGRKAQASPSE